MVQQAEKSKLMVAEEALRRLGAKPGDVTEVAPGYWVAQYGRIVTMVDLHRGEVRRPEEMLDGVQEWKFMGEVGERPDNLDEFLYTGWTRYATLSR